MHKLRLHCHGTIAWRTIDSDETFNTSLLFANFSKSTETVLGQVWNKYVLDLISTTQLVLKDAAEQASQRAEGRLLRVEAGECILQRLGNIGEGLQEMESERRRVQDEYSGKIDEITTTVKRLEMLVESMNKTSG